MKRISQLDGVRGIAVLLVVVWHYFPSEVVAEPGSLLDYCSRACSLTWGGVDLFFVLSGFLIAGILLDHRDTSNYFRVFYLRRVCRIFPLYFLALGIFVCFSATSLSTSPALRWVLHDHDPLPLWSYATFTQNFFMAARGNFGPLWLGVTWSLAVEEQFYLFVPLLIYLLPRRVLLCVLLAAVLAAPVLRSFSPGFPAYMNTLLRSDSLLSGAALAVLVRWHPFVAAARRHRNFLLAGFALLLAGVAFMTVRRPHMGSAIGHFWLAALFTVFILIAFLDAQPHLGRLLRSPVLVWFGTRSYGIYMFHHVMLGVMHGWLRHSPPVIRTPVEACISLLALLVTLVLATLSYRFFESPFLRLGHRFQYSPKSRPDASLPALPNQTSPY